MRTLGLNVLLNSSSIASAQPLDGAYRGSISGTPATLTLHQDGTARGGAIDAGGYGYTIAGTVGDMAHGTADGTAASGTLTDPQAGSAMPFELAVYGNGLTLTLLAADSYGQAQRVPFTFQHSGGTAPREAVPGAPLGRPSTGAAGRAARRA